MSGSTTEEIDCKIVLDNVDIQKVHLALDCYKTFLETIEKSGVKNFIINEAYFEIYGENYTPPLNSLFENLES